MPNSVATTVNNGKTRTRDQGAQSAEKPSGSLSPPAAFLPELLPFELEEHATLLQDLRRDFVPATRVESELVDDLAATLTRLRRHRRRETEAAIGGGEGSEAGNDGGETKAIRIGAGALEGFEEWMGERGEAREQELASRVTFEEIAKQERFVTALRKCSSGDDLAQLAGVKAWASENRPGQCGEFGGPDVYLRTLRPNHAGQARAAVLREAEQRLADLRSRWRGQQALDRAALLGAAPSEVGLRSERLLRVALDSTLDRLMKLQREHDDGGGEEDDG